MAKKEADTRTKLAKELKGLIDEIPEEGLQFLIDQANTIIYNMKVDEVNRAAERLQASRKKSAGGKAGASKKGAGGKAGGGEEPLVWVEQGSKGSSMFLVINNTRKIMDPDEEMLPLVRIAHKAKSKQAGKGQLFKWLDRERDDVVIDAGLEPDHPAMGELYDYLKKHFSLNK
jgi:hypothetical protein